MLGKRYVEEHGALFRELWHRFEAVAEVAHKAGNKIAIDWLRSCAYWRFDCVKRLRKYDLRPAKVDGCAYGMGSPSSKPMLKPWTIATNDEVLAEQLPKRCPGHGAHAQVAGALAAGSAGYPKRMA